MRPNRTQALRPGRSGGTPPIAVISAFGCEHKHRGSSRVRHTQPFRPREQYCRGRSRSRHADGQRWRGQNDIGRRGGRGTGPSRPACASHHFRPSRAFDGNTERITPQPRRQSDRAACGDRALPPACTGHQGRATRCARTSHARRRPALTLHRRDRSIPGFLADHSGSGKEIRRDGHGADRSHACCCSMRPAPIIATSPARWTRPACTSARQ